ncbi:MAG: imidazole glycerol phosphate synthase subunit HisH [Gammaproteobacteria bacterium]|nr:imidazole glycerol phosphate synthase subunit HisH [Gammaproteobacteria bacterium]
MVTVIDYGMGNVWSVLSALQYLGSKTDLTGDPEKIVNADYLILPGVGSFRKGMIALHERGVDEAIIESVSKRGTKILGICLGMQLLGSHGTEDGKTEGLGLITNRVERFSEKDVGVGGKIPHVGFNTVNFSDEPGLFQGLHGGADFYFTHSYRMIREDLKGHVGLCSYGLEFLAAFEVNNVCGTQFHPEKSQTNGLVLLRNFIVG